MHIVIVDHPDTLETIERGGKIIRVLGKGVMKSPGHPAGNQQYHNQMDFLTSITKAPYKVPVFNKDTDNHIEYLGKYKLLGWGVRMSWPGFRYFEFILTRVDRSTPGEVPVYPPE